MYIKIQSKIHGLLAVKQVHLLLAYGKASAFTISMLWTDKLIFTFTSPCGIYFPTAVKPSRKTPLFTHYAIWHLCLSSVGLFPTIP